MKKDIRTGIIDCTIECSMKKYIGNLPLQDIVINLENLNKKKIKENKCLQVQIYEYNIK